MTTRVKICGIRSAEVMRAALEAGVDYVGLNFFASSPRYVTLADARALADIARGRARIVALVVDPDDATIDEIVRMVRPDVLQLHGRETPERCREVKARWPLEVMKVISVGGPADVARASDYADSVDLIMFDAKPPKDAVLPGGNGVPFDWTMLTGVSARLDYILAGGLTPDNVAEAIRWTGAKAVDVSSGVEQAPGVKDEVLIRRFIANARAA